MKTEYSEDELPLDAGFAEMLIDCRAQCPRTDDGSVFLSPLTGRPYHASPIQQDYTRPAGEALGLGRIGWHTFPSHLPLVAGCRWSTSWRAAEVDAARAGINDDERLWKCVDGRRAAGEFQGCQHGLVIGPNWPHSSFFGCSEVVERIGCGGWI